MFDVGFLEILIVLIIALLVIGPQRMPEVARKLGGFMGKTKRFIESVKQEGHLQETVDELKKSMDLQEEKSNLVNLEKDLQESMNQSVEEIDMASFQRPTFGGAEPVDSDGGSQFSKAPEQPQPPAPNVAAQITPQDNDQADKQKAHSASQSQTVSEPAKSQTVTINKNDQGAQDSDQASNKPESQRSS